VKKIIEEMLGSDYQESEFWFIF